MALALVVLVCGAAMLAFLRFDQRYFWDDRFSQHNVERLVIEKRVLPNWYYWYSPPSYLPQAWAVRLTNAIAAASDSPGWLATDPVSGDFTRFGIRLTRAFGIAYGGLALLLLAALGRQVSGERTAALAALVFASSPWAIYGIAGFKPDPLLLLATLACLVALGDFVRGGRPLRYWTGALLFGVATAAKLNGALLAVPLAVAALGAGSWRTRLGRLIGGGALAVAVELALSPFPRQTMEYLRKVDSLYDSRGIAPDTGLFEMAGILLAKLAQPNFLGLTLALAAGAGLAIALVHLARDPKTPAARAWALLLAFGVSNLVFLAATSRYPKENHLLQLLPIAALLAGEALARPLDVLARRRAGLAALALVALSLLFAARATLYVAKQIVPATHDDLARELRRELGGAAGRSLAWFARDGEALRVGGGRGTPAVSVQFALDQPVAAAVLTRFDCLAGEGAPPEALSAALRARFAVTPRPRAPLSVRWIPGRDVELWSGCAPWPRAGDPVELRFEPEPGGIWRSTLPGGLPPHDAISIEVKLRTGESMPRLRVGEVAVPLEFATASRRAGETWSSQRIAAQPPASAVTLTLDGEESSVLAALHLWRDPAPAPPAELSPRTDSER